MQKQIFLLFAFGSVLLNGCYYDNEEELYPNSFCDTVNVTYSNKVGDIVRAKCAIPGCHVAGGGGTGDFTQFSGVSAQVANGKFLQTVKRGPGSIPMPPSGPLRPCEVQQIEKWIANGAANN